MAYAAGVDDVDEYLAGITPEKFNGWCEMNELIPFGDEKLAWVMAAGFALMANIALANPMGCGEVKDTIKPRDLIPWMKKAKREKPKQKYMNPNQMAAMFKTAVGS